MSYDITHPIYPMCAIGTSGIIASQSITVSTAAIGIGTAFDPTVVKTVTFDVQDQGVRVRFDTDPTSTVGHILPASTAYEWDVARFNRAKFIRISTATGDATIFASPSTT
jgi:hypothetical protein